MEKILFGPEQSGNYLSRDSYKRILYTDTEALHSPRSRGMWASDVSGRIHGALRGVKLFRSCNNEGKCRRTSASRQARSRERKHLVTTVPGAANIATLYAES
ncbi:hypothetical protein J6590_023269 [Homalodisca vitripennis]|nr:hypothetical protein J6590_023269 [Homalodisca vitripennis]